MPIPQGTPINYPGLLSVDMPPALERGRNFNVIVRQITNASGLDTSRRSPVVLSAPANSRARATNEEKRITWRRIIGAFQLSIPAEDKSVLLLTEQRRLSVLSWIGEAIPVSSRWYPVFQRYLAKLGGRVQVFGGNPGLVLPSPTGNWSGGHQPGHGPGEGHHREFSGKVSGLIFDRFGDFEGFLLDTARGERRFFSREPEMRLLTEREWRERLFIVVYVDHACLELPISIVIRHGRAAFDRP